MGGRLSIDIMRQRDVDERVHQIKATLAEIVVPQVSPKRAKAWAQKARPSRVILVENPGNSTDVDIAQNGYNRKGRHDVHVLVDASPHCSGQADDNTFEDSDIALNDDRVLEKDLSAVKGATSALLLTTKPVQRYKLGCEMDNQGHGEAVRNVSTGRSYCDIDEISSSGAVEPASESTEHAITLSISSPPQKTKGRRRPGILRRAFARASRARQEFSSAAKVQAMYRSSKALRLAAALRQKKINRKKKIAAAVLTKGLNIYWRRHRVTKDRQRHLDRIKLKYGGAVRPSWRIFQASALQLQAVVRGYLHRQKIDALSIMSAIIQCRWFEFQQRTCLTGISQFDPRANEIKVSALQYRKIGLSTNGRISHRAFEFATIAAAACRNIPRHCRVDLDKSGIKLHGRDLERATARVSTRYPLVLECIRSHGFAIFKDGKRADSSQINGEGGWELTWSDTARRATRFIRDGQWTNQIPGINHITNKCQLTRKVIDMTKALRNEFSFYPQSWTLPQDRRRLEADVKRHCRTHICTYIFKPNETCQGKGISLLQGPDLSIDWNAMPAIVQRYLSRPLLIDGFKFDLRVYATVIIKPGQPNNRGLEIYLAKDGLCRMCTVPYEKPTADNLGRSKMHLSNYAINKVKDVASVSARDYVRSVFKKKQKDQGTKPTALPTKPPFLKRTIGWVANWLDRGYGVGAGERLWCGISDIVTKTVLSSSHIWFAKRHHDYKTTQRQKVRATMSASPIIDRQGKRLKQRGTGDIVQQDSKITDATRAESRRKKSQKSQHDPVNLKDAASNRNGMFHVLGFDIMLDERRKPWLIEVNMSPSFNGDSPIDRMVKGAVVGQALDLCGLQRGAGEREKRVGSDFCTGSDGDRDADDMTQDQTQVPEHNDANASNDTRYLDSTNAETCGKEKRDGITETHIVPEDYRIDGEENSDTASTILKEAKLKTESAGGDGLKNQHFDITDQETDFLYLDWNAMEEEGSPMYWRLYPSKVSAPLILIVALLKMLSCLACLGPTRLLLSTLFLATQDPSLLRSNS